MDDTIQVTAFCGECNTRIHAVDGLWLHDRKPEDEHEAIPQTEEQATARIAAWRCRKALSGASVLAQHVRSLAVNGRTESGETLAEWSAPMKITAADDVDALFAQLVNWVGFWSESLEVAPPSTAIVAWSNVKEVQGFRAGTTPEGAHFLVSLQTMWLNLRADAIDRHESADVYRADIVQLLGALRGKYPMAPRPAKPISLRPCPLCGEQAVGATWLPVEDVSGLSEKQVELVQLVNVDVRCEKCGLFVPVISPSQLLRWLT